VLGGFGKDIDSHDTVMRYNTPIKGYEQHVGTKTALLWSKSKYSGSRPPTLGYVFSKVAGQSPLYTPVISGLRTFRDQVQVNGGTHVLIELIRGFRSYIRLNKPGH
jgi:hypothetical protein